MAYFRHERFISKLYQALSDFYSYDQKLDLLIRKLEAKRLYREANRLKSAKRIILLQIFQGKPIFYDLDKEEVIISPTDSRDIEPPSASVWLGGGRPGP